MCRDNDPFLGFRFGLLIGGQAKDSRHQIAKALPYPRSGFGDQVSLTGDCVGHRVSHLQLLRAMLILLQTLGNFLAFTKDVVGG